MRSNWKSIVFFVLITMVYFSRAFFLESDPPPWGLVTYQPIDEGIYANLALNMVNFGSIDPNDYYGEQYEYLMQSHVICDVVGNLFTGVTLAIFGDNYFGLRMGVVCAGYLVLILFCLTIAELRKAYGAKEPSAALMALFLILTLLASFIFFNATKVVEPSIFRLLLVQVVVFCLVKADISIKARGFLVGFFVFVSIFLVYVTNLFLGIPVLAYAAFVLATQGKRRGASFILFGLAGALLAYAIAAAYYWFCWDTTPIANAINSVLIFESSGQSADAYAVGLGNSLRNIRAFFISNAMFYVLPIAAIVFICFIPLFKKACKPTGGPILVLLMTVVGFFAQTIMSDDFVLRKSIIIFPTLLLLFFCVFLWVMKLNEGKVAISKKILLCAASAIALAIAVYATYYRLFRANSPTFTRLDYSEMDILVLVAACVVAVVIILVFLMGMLENNRKAALGSLFASVLICIALNVCMVLQYNVFNQTYEEKEVMIKLGEVADGKVIAGEYENGFTLYNDILPLLHHEKTLAGYMKENHDLLYFDYANAGSFSKDPESVYQQIREVERFERAYQTFGKKRSVALYEFDE